MNKNKLWLITFLLLALQVNHVRSSYFLKTALFKGFLNLLYKGARVTTKTVFYGVPTLFGLSKIESQIIKEQQEFVENFFFVYPFDKEAQKQNKTLKNDIEQHALQTMPEKWKNCSSVQELLQKISDEKEEALEKLKEVIKFEGSLPSWQERSAASKKWIEQLMQEWNEAHPESPRPYHHGDGGRSDLLKETLMHCEQIGIDTNAITVQIAEYASLPQVNQKTLHVLTPGSGMKSLYTPQYTMQIHPKYIEKKSFLKPLIRHETNHQISGDSDYLTKFIDSLQQKIHDYNFKSSNKILKNIKEAWKLKQDDSKMKNAWHQFSVKAEYHADINQILSDSVLTTQEKANMLTDWAHWFECLMTFTAKAQIEGQKENNRLFNNVLMHEGCTFFDNHDAKYAYDLTQQNAPSHPSSLSRYQLIMRAVQLLSSE